MMKDDFRLSMLMFAGMFVQAEMHGRPEIYPGKKKRIKVPVKSKEEKRAMRIKRMQNRGLKRFEIAGREIWAINQKNAYRKYQKQVA